MTTLPSLDELERLAKACVTINLDTADPETSGDGIIDCPHCGGEGTVDAKWWTNFDNAPVGIQVYGIGDAMTKLEKFVRAANPRAILALIEENRRLEGRAHSTERELIRQLQSLAKGKRELAAEWLSREVGNKYDDEAARNYIAEAEWLEQAAAHIEAQAALLSTERTNLEHAHVRLKSKGVEAAEWHTKYEVERTKRQELESRVGVLESAMRECEVLIEDKWAQGEMPPATALHAIHKVIDTALSHAKD